MQSNNNIFLFRCPIITHEPLDQFASNVDWRTWLNVLNKNFRDSWVPKLVMYITCINIKRAWEKKTR